MQIRSEVLVERLMSRRDLKQLGEIDPSEWLRLTDFSRTIQSVQALLSGLLPTMPRAVIKINARRTLKMIPDSNPRVYVDQAKLERELTKSPRFVNKEHKMKPLAIWLTKVLFDYGVRSSRSGDSKKPLTNTM